MRSGPTLDVFRGFSVHDRCLRIMLCQEGVVMLIHCPLRLFLFMLAKRSGHGENKSLKLLTRDKKLDGSTQR